MSNQEIQNLVNQKAQKWLEGKFDQETKNKVKYLMEHDQNELIECFTKTSNLVPADFVALWALVLTA